MRRLMILAVVAAVVAAAGGCRCGGLFHRHSRCVSHDCPSCCDDFGDEHEVYSEGSAPVWEESIPVPRGR